ncbi:replication initiator [Streptomyces tendae]|uniref:replication initiator n=1 Tax=Streptomyces tendae TaxID=1932 RepID=UPI0033C8AA8E
MCSTSGVKARAPAPADGCHAADADAGAFAASRRPRSYCASVQKGRQRHRVRPPTRPHPHAHLVEPRRPPRVLTAAPAPWTHALGYRGHILTKSRAYFTTYAALRAERAHHVGHADIPDANAEAQWRYIGSVHTPTAFIAAGVAADLAENQGEARSQRGAHDR